MKALPQYVALLVLFTVVTVALAPTGLLATEPVQLRVLSYNIHHGEGIDRELDLERIARVILSVQPDLVALQEVDRRVERSGWVDQPAELSRLTKMKVVFEKNIDFQGGQYGNAVLSRLPIAAHKNVQLPRLDEGEQRGVLVCEVKPPKLDQAVLFLATHLDHRPHDRERLASARQINQLVAKRRDAPAILAGDLNATPDGDVLAAFDQKWKVANQDELPTVPVGEPRRQIDFILSRPAGRWQTIDCRVLDEAVASDHRAIFAVLRLVPSPKMKPRP